MHVVVVLVTVRSCAVVAGIFVVHLLWPHKRSRLLGGDNFDAGGNLCIALLKTLVVKLTAPPVDMTEWQLLHVSLSLRLVCGLGCVRSLVAAKILHASLSLRRLVCRFQDTPSS